MNLFRPLDPITRQLRETARQGSGMAHIAHLCSMLLVILFSLGSLIALSSEAVTRIAKNGLTPATIPDAINATVSTLLVVCMDVAMLYAASKMRILLNRRAERKQLYSHIGIFIVASLLESLTYIYMSVLYDHPDNFMAWALIVSRALAAPVFGVYLSLARPIPVGPNDILYQVELTTGHGLIQDLARIVAQPGGLDSKAEMYKAAAPVTPNESTRLSNLIGVVQNHMGPSLTPPDGGTPVIVEADSLPYAEPDKVVNLPVRSSVAALLNLDPHLPVEELVRLSGVAVPVAEEYRRSALGAREPIQLRAAR